MIYIGIDPGLHGAIAILDKTGAAFALYDMPLSSGWYDIPTIYSYLLTSWSNEPKTIGLEAVYRFPKVTRGFGLLEGVGTLVPRSTLIKIPPRRWQKWWGIKKADKELSRWLAIKRFPRYAEKLKRKLDHNRAEALLIAEYTRKVHKNG